MKFHFYLKFLYCRAVILLALTGLILSGMSCALPPQQPEVEEKPIPDMEDPIAKIAVPPTASPQNLTNPLAPPDWREKEVERARKTGELVVGMTTGDVLDLWGKPQDVETAGDPQLGHQRWIYRKTISERWNLHPKRIIYFESGKVVGWENAI